MSLKVSSGLKATAQEWTPSFATSAAPAAAPTSQGQGEAVQASAAGAQTGGFNQFYAANDSEYYGPNSAYYNADAAAYAYYQPNPWDLATMGAHGGGGGAQQPRGNSRQGRRGAKGQRSQQGRRPPQHGQQRGEDSAGISGIPGGIPITKKKKKKKKKSKSAGENTGSGGRGNNNNNTVMKPVEIVPNRILVFKNLPFSFTVKELEDIIEQQCHLKPATTSFHRDKNGQFKGFCFVYFDSIESATLVLDRLNGYELQGRTWSIEFKRVNNEESDSAAGSTLIPASSSMVRSGSHDGGRGGLCAMAGGMIPKLSAGRSKFRSVSESDADMNWRRSKVESDFPPKDEAGRKIYRTLMEYKEKHAAAARVAALKAQATDASASPSEATVEPTPLEIAILPSQKTLQRLLQECLKRLNLDHRIKDEVGEQITYEITPRPLEQGGRRSGSGGGMMGAAAGETFQRRRRGGSTGAFGDDARLARAARRTSGAEFVGPGEKTIKAPKYAALTVLEAAEQQAAALQSPATSNGISPATLGSASNVTSAAKGSSSSASPVGGEKPVGEQGKSSSGAPATLGMSALGASARGLVRNKDRADSREFGSRIASGPDGSPGFQQGPRGRFGSPSHNSAGTLSSGAASPNA